MIVKETPQVRKQINHYKRFLEKPELFNHAAQLNDQFYYNVQYWRWGKNEAVGYLILRSDGTVPPRAEALPVVRLFMSHNNSAVNFTTKLAADKDKPVWMYQQKRECLWELLPYCKQEMDQQMLQDVADLIAVCDLMVKSVDQLQDLFDEGMRQHKQMLARMYVTQEDEQLLRDVMYKSDFLLYERLRRQVEIIEGVDRLYAFFRTANLNLGSAQKKTWNKLVGLLRDYSRNDIRMNMKQSIRDMEIRNVPYQNVGEMRQIIDEKNKEIFQQQVFPILRNP